MLTGRVAYDFVRGCTCYPISLWFRIHWTPVRRKFWDSYLHLCWCKLLEHIVCWRISLAIKFWIDWHLIDLAGAYAGIFVFDFSIFTLTLHKVLTLPRGNSYGLLTTIMRDGMSDWSSSLLTNDFYAYRYSLLWVILFYSKALHANRFKHLPMQCHDCFQSFKHPRPRREFILIVGPCST